MDDPWGSPWADEVPLEDKKGAEGSRGATLKTQTPVKAASLALEVNSRSPWDDNEEIGKFGNWSASPELEGEGLERPRADGAWHRNVGRDESSQNHPKSLSPRWEEDLTLSQTPTLAPIPMPEQLRRQPSPDPWATANAAHIERRETPTTGVTFEDRVSDGSHKITHQSPSAILNNPPSSNDLLAHSGVHTPTNKGTSLVEYDLNDGTPERLQGTREQAQILPYTEPTLSRPSSSPSNGSQHEGLPDSSRTSFDEEPKRPQMPRKVSSKIQELVEHFDGLAKQDEELPQDIRRPRTHSKESLEGVSDNSVDDFGDFEEGHLDTVVRESAEEAKGNLKKSDVFLDSKTPIPSSSPPQSPEVPNVEEPKPPNPMLGPPIKPVQIAVDLSILDTLYPFAGTIQSQGSVFIPDTIPHDSFSSTEERKMWYRISRYGTMRKYNSGDDDDYVRISWPKSHVRTDTLKIVARWMEEDRISGQVILGGAGKTSSLFGWNDSKASPVSLETVFATKERKMAPAITPTADFETVGNQPVSSLSPKQQLRLGRRQSASTNSAHTSEELDASSPIPIANFGWNVAPKNTDVLRRTNKLLDTEFTSVDAGSPITPSLPSPKRTSTLPLQRIAPQKTSTVTEPAEPTPVISADANTKNLASSDPWSPPTSLLTTNTDQQDDDDDWGDLISSPTLVTPANFPPPQSLRHKKSQSLNVSALSLHDTSGRAGPQSQQDRPGHRSNLSFDEILTPKYQDITPPITISAGLDIFEAHVPVPASPSSRLGGHATESVNTATSTTGDSWASADFSFFDTPSMPKQNSLPETPKNKALSKATSLGTLPELAPPTTSRQLRQDDEHDQIVQKIVGGLPDLSYMLRR